MAMRKKDKQTNRTLHRKKLLKNTNSTNIAGRTQELQASNQFINGNKTMVNSALHCTNTVCGYQRGNNKP